MPEAMSGRTLGEPVAWACDAAPSYRVAYADGTEERFGPDEPTFTLVVRDRPHLRRVLVADAYSAGLSFINGEFDVTGDMVAAVRFQRVRRAARWKSILHAALACIGPGRVETWFQSRRRAARNIRYHYDQSNEFYRQFLDRRMVYSCAYFQGPDVSLEDAQLAKLDLICRKLDLRPGERFLDVGSGWGALLIHAAGRYGVDATGCTLSHRQAEHARIAARQALPDSQIAVSEGDFRDVAGRFDKIASVGMFEHVGRHRLRGYFRSIHRLLARGGLFLNHGIVRPAFVSDAPDTLFLQRRVFPGGELPHLADVIRDAELEGFEVLDVEDLRPHYGLTCRAWVERLQQRSAACLEAVTGATYRTWLLYLAAAADSFENATTNVCQVLLTKRDKSPRRATRDYMYVARGI